MPEKVCCCHAVTGAAIVGCAQLIILFMTLSASGLILDRYTTWQGITIVTTASAITTTKNGTIDAIPTRWSTGLVEITMAWYCGFCAVWFISLLILCLAFKYYRPVFTIPNFVCVIVAIIADILAGGVLLGRILDVDRPYQTAGYEDVMMVYFVAFLVFALIVLIICAFFVAQFHKFLKETNGLVLPLAAGGRRSDDRAWE